MARYNFIDKASSNVVLQIQKSFFVLGNRQRNKDFHSSQFSLIVKDKILRNEPLYNGSYGVVSKLIINVTDTNNNLFNLHSKSYLDSHLTFIVLGNEDIILNYNSNNNNLEQINTFSTAGNSNDNPDSNVSGSIKEFWA